MNLMILEVFSNLNDSMILVRQTPLNTKWQPKTQCACSLAGWAAPRFLCLH